MKLGEFLSLAAGDAIAPDRATVPGEEYDRRRFGPRRRRRPQPHL